MGRAVRATEKSLHVQEIRVHMHHKKLQDDPNLPMTEVAVGPEGPSEAARKISHLPCATAAYQQWLLLLFCLLNLSLAESKSESCHLRILGGAVSRFPVPTTWKNGRGLSKTGIGLGTKRQYPASIQNPDAETTLSSSPTQLSTGR